MPSSRYYRAKTFFRKEKIGKIKSFIFWFFFAVGFLTILWSFFLSPFFKITEIKIPHNDIVANGDVKQLIANNRPFNLGQNLLMLNTGALRANLAANFSEITDIVVKKELFHSLIINFNKRISLGLWCHPAGDQPQSGKCYYFDKEGIIFKEAPQTEGALILKITNFGQKEAQLGKQVLNRDLLNFIVGFNEKVEKIEKLKIKEFKIQPAPNVDLEAVTGAGWSIYLDSAQNPALAAANLLTVLEEALKNKINNLSYIDLRISSRIFYKLR